MRTSLVPIAVLAVLACSKKDDKAAEKAGEAAAVDFVAESATKDLAELEKAIADGKPSDGRYKCAHMANIDDLKKASKHQALAAKLEQLCTKDLHLAIIKVEVEKAEAARKAKPDEKVLSECFNADYDVAKKEMAEAKTIDLAKDLIARFEAACPQEPK